MVAQRLAFGRALADLAKDFPRMVVLDVDVAPSTQTHLFGAAYPQRFYQIGIAEQNAVGIAAGMAAGGLVPWVSAFAVFLAHRAGDQIRNSVAHPGANVKLNGSYAGLPTGRAGATHSAVEDLAVLRSLPNMTIFEPADSFETAHFTRLATQMEGPVYLRTVRCELPDLFDDTHRPAAGEGVLLREGADVGILSTGMMTARALDAARLLESRGIRAGVLHLPTIKPLDENAVAAMARKTGRLVTVENHSVIGGLGGAVCEALARLCPCPVRRLGYQDIFLESGDDETLFARYGLTAEAIAAAAQEHLQAPLQAQAGGM